MIFQKNSRFGKAVSMLLTALAVFFIMSGEFRIKALAADSTIVSITQEFNGSSNSSGSVSEEQFINNLTPIKYLTISIANTEGHYYCYYCGSTRSSSVTKVNIYGYRKDNGSETVLGTYSLSGLDGSSRKTSSSQMMITDSIKDTYAYLKISASISGFSVGTCSHSIGDGAAGYYSNGSGYATIISSTYDEPVFQSGGNLSDKTMTEGVSDYVGMVSGYFPGGAESYTWQYSEGDSWNTLNDGTTSFRTQSHGTMELRDKNGGTDFSVSNGLRLNNPAMEMTGLKFRVILNSDTGTGNTTSNEAALTVNSRNAEGFYSARYASRYGQVGDKLQLNDIISYIKFNNGQIIETQKLLESDAKRVSYYGIIEPSDKGKSIETILKGLEDGSVSYTELGADSADVLITEGDNVFFLKFSYEGRDSSDHFISISFSGKDERPPVFDENVELYEKDGMTLYTRGNYSIPDNDKDQMLKIKGLITDSVSENESIRWAYTLTDVTDSDNEIIIPVYRTGNEIDIDVTKNGTYTLLAEDDAGNSAQKTIVVKAFDENDPVLECDVRGIAEDETSGYFSGFVISASAEDEEKLSKTPFLYRYFGSKEEAESFNLSSVSKSEYVSSNSYAVKQPGFYLVSAMDAVGKTAKKILKVPENNNYVIDSESPGILISPVPVKESSSSMTEYNIEIIDDHKLKNYVIETSGGEKITEKVHDHSACDESSCSESYHFISEKAGNYKIIVKDQAGNKAEAEFSVAERIIEGVEITDLSESMSVNSEIQLKSLIQGSRILLKMSDGTTDIYSGQDGVKAELLDENDNPVEKITIGYGENRVRLMVTIDSGSDNEKVLKFEKTVTGEDNVAPIPGILCSDLTEGWDGSLTNNPENKITLHASGCEDDGSQKENLIVTWYKDDIQVQEKALSDNGDIYGPFSGEEANGTYRYTVTDENGNTGFSTSEKVILCWDMTPPSGEIRLLPEGTDEDSKARYKQVQIVNASDEYGLAPKPYSFRGDAEESYTVLSSVVAGENTSYEIYLKDSAGNTAHLGDINLSGIDSIAPTINGYEINDDEKGGKILHVDAVDTDSNGEDNTENLIYSIDGEKYQESPDFEIDGSGSYTIYVKDDTGNITRTSTDYTDTDAPYISIKQDESGAGALIVQVSDNVGLSRVILEGPDGHKEILQVYDGSTEDTIRKEIDRIGEYKASVTDMAGNTESASVNVVSIAAACSQSVLTGLKVTPGEWTNGDVTVIAQLADTEGLSSAPFRWNNSISSAQPYMTVTENGDVSVEICDKYGNSIASQTITVGNIDKLPPVLAELVQSEDKNHLMINASDKGSGISQITISGGPYSVETGAVTLNGETDPDEISLTLPTNGTYTVRAYDRAGNSAQRQITVEGVTTDIAKIEYKEIEKVIEKTVPEEKIVTKTETVTQTVEKAVPILVPVPTTETVIKYKTLKEKGEDTSTLIKGDDVYHEDTKTTETVKSETVENEKNLNKSSEKAVTGTYTKDGTYIAPDGYEYFGRVDPNMKKDDPLKYWFKKNAEKIAVAACILALLFLILCIIMAIMLVRDYHKEQNERNIMKKNKNRTGDI